MAIAFGRTAALSDNGPTPVGPLSITINAGETVVCLATLDPTTEAVTSFTDSGGSVYASRVTPASQGNVRGECWSTGAGLALASTTVSMAFSGTAADNGLIPAAYTGVLSLGNSSITTGTGANPSITLATQDANGWVVAGFAALNGSLPSAGTGNLRQNDGNIAIVQALVDNTSASPGNVTCSITLPAGSWVGWALELRPVAGAGPVVAWLTA